MTLAIALAIIAFAGAFHVWWAIGGRLGYSVSLPQRPDGTPVLPDHLPRWRPAAAAVALCLMGLALLLLARAGHVRLPVPRDWIRWALLLAGAACVARAIVPNRYVGFFKTLRTTRWARYDTRFYSPLFLLLGLAILWEATR